MKNNSDKLGLMKWNFVILLVKLIHRQPINVPQYSISNIKWNLVMEKLQLNVKLC